MFTVPSRPELAVSHPARHCGKWCPPVSWGCCESGELPRWPLPGQGFWKRPPAPSPYRPGTSGWRRRRWLRRWSSSPGRWRWRWCCCSQTPELDGRNGLIRKTIRNQQVILDSDVDNEKYARLENGLKYETLVMCRLKRLHHPWRKRTGAQLVTNGQWVWWPCTSTTYRPPHHTAMSFLLPSNICVWQTHHPIKPLHIVRVELFNLYVILKYKYKQTGTKLVFLFAF